MAQIKISQISKDFNLKSKDVADAFKEIGFEKKNSGASVEAEEFELFLDMPGFEKEDIALSLESGYLTVEAKREEKEEDGKNYLRRERTLSTKRSFYVGEAVTEEDIKAKYNNGTLVINVPKKDKKELPKKNIAIE